MSKEEYIEKIVAITPLIPYVKKLGKEAMDRMEPEELERLLRDAEIVSAYSLPFLEKRYKIGVV